jgi:Protein of unknown function (DUF2510)/Fibronectin type III domain
MTPAGWYSDPSLRHEYRYWDGLRWTPHVSDRGLTASDPELRPSTNPDGAPAAHPLRWIVPVIAVVAVLAVIAGLVLWAPWGSELPATPAAVREQARTSTSVLVQWDSSTTGPTVDRYLILRDGVQVGSVPGTVTSYKDQGLSPATVYEYRVVALSGDVRSAPSAILLVKTLLPPI